MVNETEAPAGSAYRSILAPLVADELKVIWNPIPKSIALFRSTPVLAVLSVLADTVILLIIWVGVFDSAIDYDLTIVLDMFISTLSPSAYVLFSLRTYLMNMSPAAELLKIPSSRIVTGPVNAYNIDH